MSLQSAWWFSHYEWINRCSVFYKVIAYSNERFCPCLTFSEIRVKTEQTKHIPSFFWTKVTWFICMYVCVFVYMLKKSSVIAVTLYRNRLLFHAVVLFLSFCLVNLNVKQSPYQKRKFLSCTITKIHAHYIGHCHFFWLAWSKDSL